MGQNINYFLREIESDMSSYADGNLMDRISLRRDTIDGMRKFGNDICYLQETVLKIEGGYADLPENFFSLSLAASCEPLGFKRNNIERSELQSSIFYKERVRFSSEWNECSSCCEDQSESIIRENLYINLGSVEFFYRNPVILSLGKAFDKSLLHSECRNRIVRDCPSEINIVNEKLQANFNSGYIYLIYNGFPVDESGQIDIPKTRKGDFEEYLEYRVKRKLLERLIGNSDGQSIATIYSNFFQLEREAKKAAFNDFKMKKINPQSLTRRLKRLNTLESLQYESNIPWTVRRV